MEFLQCITTVPGGSGQCNSCISPLHCRLAVGGAMCAISSCACGQWAVELLQCIAPPLGVVGSGTPAIHCHAVRWQSGVELVQFTATLLVGSGWWNFRNEPPHCPGNMGHGTLAMHRHTARGHLPLELM